MSPIPRVRCGGHPDIGCGRIPVSPLFFRRRGGDRENAQSQQFGLLRLGVICVAFAWCVIAPAQALAAGQTPKADSATSEDSSPARFDKELGFKGWNIPFPSFGDTLLQDAGGFRSALAKLGVGFLEFNLVVTAVNMLNTPRQSRGAQVYWGQRFSAADLSIAFLAVDMGRYGIGGGQLQLSAEFSRSSWEPFTANTFSLACLAYYQSLFDSKIELLVGYKSNAGSFVGSSLGGNLANPFGPSVAIPYELGLSATPAAAPTVQIKINIAPNFYNQFAVQRSLPPTGNSFLTNARLNPTGFRFLLPDARLLFIDEAGFKREATPAARHVWIRLGAMYNNSRYADFSRPGKTAEKSGFYLLGDWQILRFDPSSAETAYRGLYFGGSAMYATPQTNVVTQYYEARAYIASPFPCRPKDQIGLVYLHQVFSQYLAETVDSSTGSFARSFSNTITSSYTLRVLSGLYVTGAFSYTDHPSFVFVAGEGSAFNFLASLFVVL
jgi:porin